MEQMQFNEFPEVSRRDFYYVIFRHKWKIVTFFAMVVLAVASFTYLSPKVYRSSAKILVRLGWENVSLDPTATTGTVISVTGSREAEMNSEMEILRSSEVAEMVVKVMGAPAVLGVSGVQIGGAPADTQASPLARLLATARGLLPFGADEAAVDEGALRDRAIRRIREHLTVQILRDTNIISAYYTAQNPELAQRVLDQVIDQYRDRRFSVYRSPGAYDFFMNEKMRIEGELTRIEGELKDLHNATGIASPSEQLTAVLDRIRNLQLESERTEAELAASRSKVENMRSVLDELIANVEESVGTGGAKANVGQGVRVRVLEPAYQQVQLAILAEEPNIASLEAKQAKLETQLAKARRDLARFNQNALRIEQLERELELQESAYQECAEGLKQARIDRALAAERISSISIVQSPTLPNSPASPRPVLNLVLAVFLGVVGGVGIAVASAYMNDSLKKPEDVERRLQMPTLVSIPALSMSPRPGRRGKQPWTESDADGVGAVVDPEPVGEDPGVAVQYETLRDRVFTSANGARPPRIIGVVSCHKGEGVTTVARNLAAMLGRRGTRPALLLQLGAIREWSANGVPHHSVTTVDNQGQTVDKHDANDLGGLLQDLAARYSFVIIDLGALLESASLPRIARLADGVILVIEAERVRSPVAERAKALLAEADARVVGAVLNKRRYCIPSFVYQRL